jgi:hypothetical protein
VNSSEFLLLTLIQIQVIRNNSLTDDQKLTETWYFLAYSFDLNPVDRDIIRFWYLEDWGGYVCDLEGVVIDIQNGRTEITLQKVIQLIGGKWF